MTKPHSHGTRSLNSYICSGFKLCLKTFCIEVLATPEVFTSYQRTVKRWRKPAGITTVWTHNFQEKDGKLLLKFLLENSTQLCQRAQPHFLEHKQYSTQRSTGLACSTGKTCFPAQPPPSPTAREYCLSDLLAFVSAFPQFLKDAVKLLKLLGTESVQSRDYSTTQEASASKCLGSADSWCTTSIHMCFSLKEVFILCFQR